MATSVSPTVIERLRQALAAMKTSDTWTVIVQPRDEVFARFQPIFKPVHLPQLTAEEFLPFLYFEHNHHWTGLYRQGSRLCSDMPRLRQGLAKLLDESRPIETRLDELDRSFKIKGLGKGIMTAILTVAYPDKYGVWNNVSEGTMGMIALWPEFERGESFGARYNRVNAVLREVAGALQIDLWTLDALWDDYGKGASSVAGVPEDVTQENPPPTLGSVNQQFGLERHLHEFLYDNWEQTELGKDWVIYSEPGEPEAGYEYNCPVGRIDILAKHRREKKWLVVELKRSSTSDAVVGQALRYMGWVKHHLADPADEVHGLVIALEGDDPLRYAISTVPNLQFMTYEVRFTLKPTPAIAKGASRA